MNPWQIAKSGSEHSEQAALFCYCAKVEHLGFNLSRQREAYQAGAIEMMKEACLDYPVPEIKFYHAIPNGGNRGDTEKSRAIEGGRMKAEGVKPGVLDTCWPLARGGYCGLYIEMKRKSLLNPDNPLAGCSEDQLAFGQFIHEQGYYATVCYGWEHATRTLQAYYEGKCKRV